MTLRAALIVSLTSASLLAAPLASAQPADASGPSADELQQKFQKHRGLVIAPSTSAPAAPAPGTTVSAEPGYIEIPTEDQVNVNIVFDFDSSALRTDQKPKLATLCQVMTSMSTTVFRIIGHTDASGSAAYNDQLSRLRAEEVKRNLVTDCGIAAERLQAVGEGERHPLNPQDPRGQENRRVEFQAIS